MSEQTTLFVGLGSAHGDDRAGWMVADALQPRLGLHAIVQRAAAPLDILNWLDGIERLAICDACRGAGSVGSWRRWPSPLVDFPVARARHSHDLGLPAAMQLAAQLRILPREVVLWVVEIGQANPDQPASEHVAAAIPAVVEDVLQALAADPSAGRPSQAVLAIQVEANHA